MNKHITTYLLSGFVALFVGAIVAVSHNSPVQYKNGFSVRITDSWAVINFRCRSYTKDGNELKCYGNSGELLRDATIANNATMVIEKDSK